MNTIIVNIRHISLIVIRDIVLINAPPSTTCTGEHAALNEMHRGARHTRACKERCVDKRLSNELSTLLYKYPDPTSYTQLGGVPTYSQNLGARLPAKPIWGRRGGERVATSTEPCEASACLYALLGGPLPNPGWFSRFAIVANFQAAMHPPR